MNKIKILIIVINENLIFFVLNPTSSKFYFLFFFSISIFSKFTSCLYKNSFVGFFKDFRQDIQKAFNAGYMKIFSPGSESSSSAKRVEKLDIAWYFSFGTENFCFLACFK